MDALVLDPNSRTAKLQIVPVPGPIGNEVLVRVQAVALNPVDALYTFHPLATDASQRRVVGSDFAGIVEQTHDTTSLKVGDRVAGFLQGASSINDRPGAFAQFAVVAHDLVWHVPDSMTFEEAATISLCGLTAAQALFNPNRLGLTAPWLGNEKGQKPTVANHKTLLIYGASTSVGLYAVQLAHASKENILLIGVASTKHAEMLRAAPYSFDHVLDRNTNWDLELRQLTKGQGVDLAFDCISEGDTVLRISKAVKPGGRLAVVRSLQGGAWKSDEKSPSKPSYGAVWEGLGEEVLYNGMKLPANTAARAFAVKFYRWLSDSNSRLRANRIRVMPGGLREIFEEGFQLLGSGLMTDRNVCRSESWMRPVSAEKLVYRVV